MNYTFITISEAARMTGQNDLTIMRAIKEYLQQPGVVPEEILKKEARDNGFFYLVNKEILLQELAKGERPLQEGQENVFRQAQQKPEQTLLSAKEEMIVTLQKILDVKDRQIEDLSGKIDQLIERSRETNILLKTMQDKLFLLEQGPPARSGSETRRAGEAGRPNKKQAQQNSAK